jgi:CRISPR/Cas system-associated protein endoribonuclease Cas2
MWIAYDIDFQSIEE